MSLAFFAGIDKDLIRFLNTITQRRSDAVLKGKLLPTMPPRENAGIIHREFFRQMIGRNTLTEAAQEQNNRSAIIPDALKSSPAEDVEHRATLPTTVFNNRGAVSIVRALPRWQGVSLRAAQARRMQDVQQKFVTPLFIQEFGDGEL